MRLEFHWTALILKVKMWWLSGWLFIYNECRILYYPLYTESKRRCIISACSYLAVLWLIGSTMFDANCCNLILTGLKYLNCLHEPLLLLEPLTVLKSNQISCQSPENNQHLCVPFTSALHIQPSDTLQGRLCSWNENLCCTAFECLSEASLYTNGLKIWFTNCLRLFKFYWNERNLKRLMA